MCVEGHSEVLKLLHLFLGAVRGETWETKQTIQLSRVVLRVEHKERCLDVVIDILYKCTQDHIDGCGIIMDNSPVQRSTSIVHCCQHNLSYKQELRLHPHSVALELCHYD